MEIISYHVAASNIDKDLLLEIITSILNEADYSEELKLKIANVISRDSETAFQ
jgi:death-on-curing protein